MPTAPPPPLPPALPPFDPTWPVEVQRAYIPLAARRINARRGAPDPTLSHHLAAFAAALIPLTTTTTSSHMQPKPTPPTPPTPPLALAPSTTLTLTLGTPTLTLGTPSPFNAAQWETLTTAARDHAKREIERATAQRARLATEIAQLQQTAEALDRALSAFRQPPAPPTAPPAPRRGGEALREALDWADSHGGTLDSRVFTRTSGRPGAAAASTIKRLVAAGQLVHVGGPRSGRYERPTPPAPLTQPADQP